MLAIKNTNIILTDHMILDGVIIIDNGEIVDLGNKKDIKIPDKSDVVDAKGNYSGPGLIDIHTHAGGGEWFFDNPEVALKSHLSHGITSILPALYSNLDKEQYLAAISRIKNVSKTKEYGEVIKGLYMEGPYLNPKYGADKSENKWAQVPKNSDYADIVEAAGDFAKVWCIAPELNGIMGFVEYTKNRIDNIVFSVAHSEASPEEIEQCIPYGLNLATHHTNATGDLVKYPECRGVSVDETVNFHNDIYAEIICDSMGIHVDPYMLRLILKIKGKDKIILISDNCVFDGPVPRGYEGVEDINFDYEGEIAGSKLTLDVACKNMLKHTGSSLCDVFNFASYNPSKLLGMHQYGQIKKGSVADIIIVDHLMNVQDVIISGKLYKK